MNYKIVFSPLAVKDLEKVYFEVFQASLDGAISKDYVDGIVEKIENKSYFPESGTPLNFNNIFTNYRYVVFKSYIAFYSIKGDTIHVDRILYSKSDYIKKLSIK